MEGAFFHVRMCHFADGNAGMTYLVKRIVLKDGQLLTERELDARDYTFDGPTPIVGDVIDVSLNGRPFSAEVIWGNWAGQSEQRHPLEIVPIRVREL